MRIALSLAIFAWGLMACTTMEAPPDAGGDGGAAESGPFEDSGPSDACFPAYDQPGCDAGSTLLCGPQDACAMVYCGCNGENLFGCGYAEQPFDHFGGCDGGGDQ